jgi:hypothetical protein
LWLNICDVVQQSINAANAVVALSMYMIFMMVFVTAVHVVGKYIPQWMYELEECTTRTMFRYRNVKVKHKLNQKKYRHWHRVKGKRCKLNQIYHVCNNDIMNYSWCKYTWSYISKLIGWEYSVWSGIQAMAVHVMGKDCKPPKPSEYDNYAVATI